MYVWDYRNRLMEVIEKDSSGNVVQSVTQIYDVFNRWIGQQVDPDGAAGSAAIQETYFIYDGTQIVLQFAGNAATDLTHRYVWGPGVDQILVEEAVTSLTTAGNLAWALTDHQNTPHDWIDSTGTVLSHITYDSYGNVTARTGSFVSLIGYTARAFDEWTGLQNNWNRWYDAEVGRWASEDPIGFAGGDPNLARYVINGPANWVDPNGLEHLPGSNRGEWIEGTRGNGTFRYFDNPQNRYAGLAGMQVRFVDNHIAVGGFPDEVYWKGSAEKASVPITTVKGTNCDDTAADRAMREKLGDPHWQRLDGYTWNHAGLPASSDGETIMELVDRDIHGRVTHKGSANRRFARTRRLLRLGGKGPSGKGPKVPILAIVGIAYSCWNGHARGDAIIDEADPFGPGTMGDAEIHTPGPYNYIAAKQRRRRELLAEGLRASEPMEMPQAPAVPRKNPIPHGRRSAITLNSSTNCLWDRCLLHPFFVAVTGLLQGHLPAIIKVDQRAFSNRSELKSFLSLLIFLACGWLLGYCKLFCI